MTRWEDKISFIGWVSNKEDFFKKIDLFVLPSRREEFPLTPLEAMEHCIPILATKNYGCLDIIDEGKNGFLTEVENSLQMSEKLQFIIENQDILPSITKNAFNKLTEFFSDKSFRQNLAKYLNKI